MNFASLCLLAYKRSDVLYESLISLKTYTNYPHEIIINDDPSVHNTKETIFKFVQSNQITKAIFNCGENRGIANAIHNCIKLSEGDFIYKLDTDLIYKPNWLTTSINIHKNNKDVIMTGLFNYKHYDPNDNRFNILEEREDCYIVNDFVSSGFGFKKETYEKYGNLLGEDGWHLILRNKGFKLAIPKEDLVTNIGFGVTRSTFVIEKDGKLTTQEHSNAPLIF